MTAVHGQGRVPAGRRQESCRAERGPARRYRLPAHRDVGQLAVLPSALPGAAFVPYAGAVPDGGRCGFERR